MTLYLDLGHGAVLTSKDYIMHDTLLDSEFEGQCHTLNF
jgi:hypothetical protein